MSRNRRAWRAVAVSAALLLVTGFPLGCRTVMPPTDPTLASYALGYDTPVDSSLQAGLETIDTRLRAKFGIAPELSDVGLLDLAHLRLAMIHPDHIEYAASVAKVGILLAYFQVHPDAATGLDRETRHELTLMIRASSNEMAAKYSRQIGLTRIQQVLDSYGFYDAAHGGGMWVGKHYGPGDERIGDPV